jgi:hypothetical protein
MTDLSVEDDLAAMFSTKSKKKKKKKKKEVVAVERPDWALGCIVSSSSLGSSAVPSSAAPPPPSLSPYGGSRSLLKLFAQPISFMEVLSSDATQSLLCSPDVRAALLPLLPDGHWTEEELDATLKCAQLKSAARAFTRAAKVGDPLELFAMLDLDVADGAEALEKGDFVRAVLDAIDASAGGEYYDEEL